MAKGKAPLPEIRSLSVGKVSLWTWPARHRPPGAIAVKPSSRALWGIKGKNTINTLCAAFGSLEIDPVAWEVRLHGEIIDLTKTEFEILLLLASRPRAVVRDEEIRRAIWGDGWFGDQNNLAVHVSKLRRKLGEDGASSRFIRTIRGVGYRFDPVQQAPHDVPTPGDAYESLLARDGAVEVHVDADLNVIATYPEGRWVVGFEPSALVGRYFALITDYPWQHGDAARDGIEKLISSGVREWAACHVVQRADGALVQADFATRLATDDRGRFLGLRYVFSERRLAPD